LQRTLAKTAKLKLLEMLDIKQMIEEALETGDCKAYEIALRRILKQYQIDKRLEDIQKRRKGQKL
jgi:hypothetical protein